MSWRCPTIRPRTISRGGKAEKDHGTATRCGWHVSHCVHGQRLGGDDAGRMAASEALSARHPATARRRQDGRRKCRRHGTPYCRPLHLFTGGADPAAPAHPLTACISRVIWATLLSPAVVNVLPTPLVRPVDAQAVERCSDSGVGTVIGCRGKTGRCGSAAGLRQNIEYAPQPMMAVTSTPYSVIRGLEMRSVIWSGTTGSRSAVTAGRYARSQYAAGARIA